MFPSVYPPLFDVNRKTAALPYVYKILLSSSIFADIDCQYGLSVSVKICFVFAKQKQTLLSRKCPDEASVPENDGDPSVCSALLYRQKGQRPMSLPLLYIDLCPQMIILR